MPEDNGTAKPGGVIAYISSGSASSPESCMSDGSHNSYLSSSPPVSRPSLPSRAVGMLVDIAPPTKPGQHRGPGGESITKINGMVLLCKGFFRRSIQQNIQYKKCLKMENCTVVRSNRNRCQQCRFKKCMSVGMSRDAVRFGRIPKREKQRMLLEMQNAMNNMMGGGGGVLLGTQQSTPLSFETSVVSMDTSTSSASSCGSDSGEDEAVATLTAQGRESFACGRQGSPVLVAVETPASDSHMEVQQDDDGHSLPQNQHTFSTPSVSNVYSGPINSLHNRAHLVCPATDSPYVEPAGTEPGQEIWEDFSMSFTPAVREVVDFAKRIPGFLQLSEHDQVGLLKAGTFEVLMVRFAALFDMAEHTVTFLSGKCYSLAALRALGAGELLNAMCEFSEKLAALHLDRHEMSLFTAVVLVSADRSGIRDIDSVEALQDHLIQALRDLVMRNHGLDAATTFTKLLLKLPELRSLNNVHSEELLSFKVHP
ncbi:hypothetical protein NHX12_000827 [Muraenolepis orangiensis]|uniref:Nuclear receptor subfamily 1 group D member 2 n=1 Tax=Muraenolepis orangiensis TaxID=630683 RepID=A0A9Q0DZK7_9TELE|nr:hypothetical protein NHX12_000827 [Muraenolepis orangiensis]